MLSDSVSAVLCPCSIRGKTERFYCSAPLVAANGHRLGTMCIGGERARKMDAHQVSIHERDKM